MGPQLTIAELERWVQFGARWRPLRIDDGHAVVELCECTGAPVERRETSDPETIEYLRSHPPED